MGKKRRRKKAWSDEDETEEEEDVEEEEEEEVYETKKRAPRAVRPKLTITLAPLYKREDEDAPEMVLEEDEEDGTEEDGEEASWAPPPTPPTSNQVFVRPSSGGGTVLRFRLPPSAPHPTPAPAPPDLYAPTLGPTSTDPMGMAYSQPLPSDHYHVMGTEPEGPGDGEANFDDLSFSSNNLWDEEEDNGHLGGQAEEDHFAPFDPPMNGMAHGTQLKVEAIKDEHDMGMGQLGGTHLQHCSMGLAPQAYPHQAADQMQVQMQVQMQMQMQMQVQAPAHAHSPHPSYQPPTAGHAESPHAHMHMHMHMQAYAETSHAPAPPMYDQLQPPPLPAYPAPHAQQTHMQYHYSPQHMEGFKKEEEPVQAPSPALGMAGGAAYPCNGAPAVVEVSPQDLRIDAILQEISELTLPGNPLDTLITELGGPDKVAEMTG